MTTALERRAKKAAKAHGAGGSTKPKVGVIAPTVSRETKRPKRETKGADDETLDAALETAGALPRSSGDGTEGIWRKPAIGGHVRLIEQVGSDEMPLPKGSVWRVIAVADTGIQVSGPEGVSVYVRKGEYEVVAGVATTEANAVDRVPTRVKLTVDVDVDAGLWRGVEFDVVEYFPPTGKVAVTVIDGPTQVLPVTAFVTIAWAEAGSIPAKQRLVPLYGGTLHTPIDHDEVEQDDAVPSKTKAKRDRRTARRQAAAPQLEPPARGAAGSKKGERGGEGKRESKPAEASAVLAAIAELPVERLPLTSLVRHPNNRKPLAADVAKRAESLKTDGQLEAIVVRPDDEALDSNGQWQILSGETRYLAAKQLGWKEISARVVECDDRRALQLLAVFNSQRQDLNPIEKARAIEDLAAAGYTRDQAAKYVGLETGAAASNLVGLLELPEVWQERVASGELHETWARAIKPIVSSPTLMKELDASYRRAHKSRPGHYERCHWQSRSSVEEFVDQIIRVNTESLDPKEKSHYSGHEVGLGWDSGVRGEYPPLFELNDANRKKLGVETITVDGKPREVATNRKAFDALQHPLVKVALQKKMKGKAAKAGARAEASNKPKNKSPAEIRAAKKKAADQLVARIAGWRHAWLKGQIAAKLTDPLRFIAAVMLNGHGNVVWPLAQAFRRTMGKAGVKLSSYGLDLGAAWSAMERLPKGPDWQNTIPITDAVRTFLVEQEDRDPRHPLIPHKVVDGLAAACNVEVDAAWAEMQREPKMPRLERFLLLHTGTQLDALAAEWKFAVEGGRDDKVQTILNNAARKPVPLPKSIKPLGVTGKRKRGRR